MKNQQFAEIIDKGECISTMNLVSNIPWPKIDLQNLACQKEWEKHNFYPSDGLVGEIYCIIEQDISLKINSDIYILKINNFLYVPMSINGIKFISESEYKFKMPKNELKEISEERRQKYKDWMINDTNILLYKFYTTHKEDTQWLNQNKSSFSFENIFNQCNEDAPLYCIQSLYLMLNNYINDPSFKTMIDTFLTNEIHLKNKDLNEIVTWVINSTNECISLSQTNKSDFENVSYWMGVASYTACHMSEQYRSQYDKIFLPAWNKFF